MPRARPAPRRRTTTDSGPTTSGRITPADVDRAADALLRQGQRPTIEKVRSHLGRGSPNTINPLLDQWWSRLAGRLDAGPAALHRLPEPVLHAAEALWLQCLDDARRRAQLEAQGSRKALARERQDLEVQTHVLGIREAELKARIEATEQRAARLELELETLTTLLRKEQASRLAAERRLTDQPAPPRPKSRKPARKSFRATPMNARTLRPKTKPRR